MKELSQKDLDRLKALGERPDDEIDFSDIPEMTSIPPDALIGKYYRPIKRAITIRLDADVLAWAQSLGAGYQTRINNYLRELMVREQRKHR
jgi:uncharacterized protein (DUF4415 family)